jgi:hypothetical protein
VSVDRARQHRAIACHVSQATDNPVLRLASHSKATARSSDGSGAEASKAPRRGFRSTAPPTA